MKCTVLVAAKANSIPIVECGGLILKPDETVVVKSALAKRMLETYKPFLLEAGECEREVLKSGSYEYSNKKPMVTLEPKRIRGDEQESVQQLAVAADKSMVGKRKGRSKGI